MVVTAAAQGLPVLRVGTRGSRLALTQTTTAARAVAAAGGLEPELVTIRTEGDVLTGPLSQMGGTGVFATALRAALLAGSVDLAVHSLKDLPTAPVPGLEVAAVPEREDPRDALCARDGLTLSGLPSGAKVGTGSPRRRCAPLALTWRSSTSAATWAPDWGGWPPATSTPWCSPPPGCGGSGWRTRSPS